MAERFTKLGGQVVADESFQENAMGFRSQLSKIQAKTPDAVFISAVTKDAARILTQAEELGFHTQWLSTAFFEGEDLLRIAGDAAEGVMLTLGQNPNNSM